MNKIIYKIFTVFSLLLITAIIIQGCSKQSDNLVMMTPSSTVAHGDGWLNPTSSNFHGNAIKTTYYWKLDVCKTCHGSDYKGGNAQTGCFNCHKYGPERCNVCHGNSQHIYPPKSLLGHTLPTEQGVGAHYVHLNSDSSVRYSAKVSCGECHIPIGSFSDTNHIGWNPGVANVVFGNLARTITEGFTPNPVWNKTAQTCSNVYCHGYFKGGNPNTQPIFTDPNSVACGSCHGTPITGNSKPISTHQYYPDNCGYCHGSVIDTNYVFVNKQRHINGVIDFNIKK
ncbi:MAG: CxxxxCH/CxxCH domain-containing protein [Ignavibacteria bacterium]|jgi:predicted CxxxxCH...CXXCH cytochrome family protein